MTIYDLGPRSTLMHRHANNTRAELDNSSSSPSGASLSKMCKLTTTLKARFVCTATTFLGMLSPAEGKGGGGSGGSSSRIGGGSSNRHSSIGVNSNSYDSEGADYSGFVPCCEGVLNGMAMLTAGHSWEEGGPSRECGQVCGMIIVLAVYGRALFCAYEGVKAVAAAVRENASTATHPPAEQEMSRNSTSV